MSSIASTIHNLQAFTDPFVQPLFLSLVYITIQSLSTIVSVWRNADNVQDEKDAPGVANLSLYDFIIVGAGSAGCLLANRLSEKYTVLLLEAGGEPFPPQFIPGFGLFLINRPHIDWRYRTVSQKYGSLASVNGESPWSAGQGLGGTGNLNLMVHLRGHKKDFDNWARITGDQSWSWEGVLPYFKSYEDYEVPGDNVNHGYTGELRIEEPDYIGGARHFIKAGLEMGYPNVDLNAPFSEGFDVVRYPIKRGVRQAPYKAFLEPVRSRPNLTIVKFAFVTKILFRDGNVAHGVEYDRHSKTYAVHAKKEVIISAGGVGSPKILMQSGIGPGDHLEYLKIPVVADLPVGENLMDHLGVYLGPFFVKHGMSKVIDRDFTPSTLVQWFTLGTGHLSSTGVEATAFISSESAKARGEGNWPDIQLFLYAINFTLSSNYRVGSESIAGAFNLKLDEVQTYLGNSEDKDSFYIVVSGARPYARGYIRLGGKSPYNKPIIDPNYLGDEEGTDLKVLIEGIKKALYLMENTTAGRDEMEAKFTTRRWPSCKHLQFRSDSYWECFAKQFSVTLHHASGTVAMGSVVDTQLRVLGVKNLRVVDASIQPVVVVGNTQAPTLMISEKAAHMIRTHWRRVES